MEQVQLPLLALAVDMPETTVDLLHRMLAEGLPAKRGVIFRSEDFGYEPLAALYPVEVIPMLRTAVRAHDFRLQNFAQAAVDASLMFVHRPSHLEQGQFKNVNTPDDLQ